jgi:hypothetical protein
MFTNLDETSKIKWILVYIFVNSYIKTDCSKTVRLLVLYYINYIIHHKKSYNFTAIGFNIRINKQNNTSQQVVQFYCIWF